MINNTGEYNCFINVVIQAVFHLPNFTDMFLQRIPEHHHKEQNCTCCAFASVLQALQERAVKSERDGNTQVKTTAARTAVPVTEFRNALSAAYGSSSKFQHGEMDDAAEVLCCSFLMFTATNAKSEECAVSS